MPRPIRLSTPEEEAVDATSAPVLKLLRERKLSPAQVRALCDQIQNPPPVIREHKHRWGRKQIRFGLCGDLHVGSKHAGYQEMGDLWRRFEAAEVERVYVTGDITEGYDRRKGHSYECDLHGFDEQVKGAAERIPRLKHGSVYFITGDHDGWHRDNGGASVGPHLQRLRPDLHFLGDLQATIEFTPMCRLMLVHPAKGTSYAISYQIQKMIEAMAGGTKPHLLAVGHYHKAEYIFYRNIHAFQTGCLQRQTPWMRRMGLSAHMGGWIVEITLNNDGLIDRVRQELIPYYE